eukprot:6051187-Pleurochrysis_carterae.AAC.1
MASLKVTSSGRPKETTKFLTKANLRRKSAIETGKAELLKESPAGATGKPSAKRSELVKDEKKSKKLKQPAQVRAATLIKTFVPCGSGL